MRRSRLVRERRSRWNWQKQTVGLMKHRKDGGDSFQVQSTARHYFSDCDLNTRFYCDWVCLWGGGSIRVVQPAEIILKFQGHSGLDTCWVTPVVNGRELCFASRSGLQSLWPLIPQICFLETPCIVLGPQNDTSGFLDIKVGKAPIIWIPVKLRCWPFHDLASPQNLLCSDDS